MLKLTRCVSRQSLLQSHWSHVWVVRSFGDGWPVSHMLLLPQSSALARFKSSNISDVGTLESDSECKHIVQTLHLLLLVESIDSKVRGGEHWSFRFHWFQFMAWSCCLWKRHRHSLWRSPGLYVLSRSVMSDSLQCHGLSPPGSSVPGILQARILEWVAMPSSKGIFLTQGSNPNCRWILYSLSHQDCIGKSKRDTQQQPASFHHGV